MEMDVRPEPTPEEREALAQAVARSLGPPPERGRSAWWRESVRENVADAEPDGLGRQI